MYRLEMVLTVLTVALTVAAAGLLLWEPPLPTTQAGPQSAQPLPAPRPVPASRAPGEAGVIVSQNMFSSTRAAPRVRYTPPGAGDEPDVAFPGEPADAGMIVETPLPQVFGTMTGPGGATALIQPDPASASGRLYREGEQVGEYRIIQITSGSVVVRGPGGRHELKIQTREAPAR